MWPHTSIARLGLLLLPLLATVPLKADDWPEWRGAQRDGVWRETGIVEQLPKEGPPRRWQMPIGAGYCGPAVAAGRVVLMDRAVDPQAQAEVKTQWNFRDKTAGQERVVCLDEATGKIVWTHAYPCAYTVAYGSGPRATPTIRDGFVYTLGAMGDLIALDLATGKPVWQKNLPREFKTEPPLYGYASPPLVDGDRLIVLVGGEGQAVVALDRRTGKLLWKAGDSTEPGYCAPIIRTVGGRRQLIAWTANALMGLDPETGRIGWSIAHAPKVGMAITTPSVEGEQLAISSQYEGTLLFSFRPDAAEPKLVWTASAGTSPERQWKKSGFNTTMSTVLLAGKHVYGTSLYGEFCCLDAATGDRVWTTLAPTSGGDVPRDRWSTVFMIPHGDRVFIFNEKGDLILARLSGAGYQEIGRAHLIEPDMNSAGNGGRKVVWSHPAFANRSIYLRNNHEIVCYGLAAENH